MKDRSTALTLVGCLQIAFGVLCAGLVPVALLPLVPEFRRQVERTQGALPDARGIVLGVAFYSIVAIFFVWTGVGAILKRRWVRPILLSAAWIWFVCGILGSIVGSLILPRILRAAFEESPNLPPHFGWIAGILITGFFAIFYVLLPLCLILFYGSRHVRTTLESRDTISRWTDACPVPVLGMSLYLGFIALVMLFASQFGAFPVFTRLVTGRWAVACALVLSALYAYFARAAYRLEPVGWWGPLVAMAGTSVSTAVYFGLGDLEPYFAAIGLREDQRRILAGTGILGSGFMVAVCSVSVSVAVGYLLWVRRYFVHPAAHAGP